MEKYATKVLKLNKDYFCAYCGKKITPTDNVFVDDFNFLFEQIYKCDCKDALDEIKINDEIANLQKQLPIAKYRLKNVNKIEYNEEENYMAEKIITNIEKI